MIFVNYGAGEFVELKHSPWNGIHFADLIFPFFIFIMGVSIAISMKNITVENIEILLKLLGKVLVRSTRLFLLGLVVNSCGDRKFSLIFVFVIFYLHFLLFFYSKFFDTSNTGRSSTLFHFVWIGRFISSFFEISSLSLPLSGVRDRF